MTRAQAERIAWESYATAEPAVVELLLLAHNGGPQEVRFRAMRALEWMDPTNTEESARPAGAVTDPAGPVEEAIEAIRWTLYGWHQASRAQAAARAGELITELAANA